MFNKKNEIFGVIGFLDFSLFYKFDDYLKAKNFLHIGNELVHFQRCDADIGPILKIPISNSVFNGQSFLTKC